MEGELASWKININFSESINYICKMAQSFCKIHITITSASDILWSIFPSEYKYLMLFGTRNFSIKEAMSINTNFGDILTPAWNRAGTPMDVSTLLGATSIYPFNTN
ncbi:hypothetical protein PR048_010989 [Dryococelus australis]|uniref:Uncharacterized protein n=1 Tax=Dryococelus australis TaxID=614101 RepID=A0ABQ9HKC9_9NEOP|nr:hypothetical protein PR048_010989 [Dryococelus australis]